MELNTFSIDEDGISMKFDGKNVSFSGNIDSLEPEKFIGPFLNKIHNYIIEKKIKSICVDIIDLDFLNSSAIKQLVEWIMKLESLSNNEKYVIKFICNKDISWQEQSIMALTFLNTELVKIELK
ncbi:MAG: SiaC family regulatory phosphoprotein [Spirochaetes bacterium]|nr:SiaC family regulatory phosphoprotein [Spirochaetota bacterium]